MRKHFAVKENGLLERCACFEIQKDKMAFVKFVFNSSKTNFPFMIATERNLKNISGIQLFCLHFSEIPNAIKIIVYAVV